MDDNLLICFALLLILFLLYNNGDGFSVGCPEFTYIGKASSSLGTDKCIDSVNGERGLESCNYNFYSDLNESDDKVYIPIKCGLNRDHKDSSNDKCQEKYSTTRGELTTKHLCDGENCPNCETYWKNNLGLTLDTNNNIGMDPIDCNDLTAIDNAKLLECQTRFRDNYLNSPSDSIVWNNGTWSGSKPNRRFNLGENTWNSSGNGNVTNICSSPDEVREYGKTIEERCNNSIDKIFAGDFKNIQQMDDDTIIQLVKTIITDENKSYANECCDGKCTSNDFDNIQQLYLRKIAKEKYCSASKTKECKGFECIGVYTPGDNNSSGSLSAKCSNDCVSPNTRLQDNSCGKVTCNKSLSGLCKYGQHCVMHHLPVTHGSPVEYRCELN